MTANLMMCMANRLEAHGGGGAVGTGRWSYDVHVLVNSLVPFASLERKELLLEILKCLAEVNALCIKVVQQLHEVISIE